MAVGMQDYELEIAACKRRLFSELFQSDIQALLEVGMGTGPNMKYYGQQQVCSQTSEVSTVNTAQNLDTPGVMCLTWQSRDTHVSSSCPA